MALTTILALTISFPLQEEKAPLRFEEYRTHEGETENQNLGFYVHNCGDLNEDGIGDYILAGPGDLKEGEQVGSVEFRSGKDGTLLFQLYGPHEGSNFGRIAIGVGDVTGDGVVDLAISATKESARVKEGGSLRVFSGKDQKLVHLWHGDEAYDKFGRSLAIISDLDGDSVQEILVGGYQPNGLHKTGRGYVRLYSGKKGNLLRTISGLRPKDMFGVTLCNSGDMNRDGVDDFAVGSFFARRKDPGRQPSVGSVSAFNGTNGELLWRKFATDYPFAQNETDNPTFGRKVCSPGDLNGDGYSDLLASAPLWDAPSTKKSDNRGMVLALSGKDGSLLKGGEMPGAKSGAGFGHSVAKMGDVNGDGRGDFLVSAMSGGYIELRSGSDFSVLARIGGWPRRNMFSQSIRAAGDLDGDGISEVIVGEPGATINGKSKAGKVYIFKLVSS